MLHMLFLQLVGHGDLQLVPNVELKHPKTDTIYIIQIHTDT